MNQLPDPRPDWTQIGHVKMYRDSVLFVRCDQLTVTYQQARWYLRRMYGLERLPQSFQSWQEVLAYMNDYPLEECKCSEEHFLAGQIGLVRLEEWEKTK